MNIVQAEENLKKITTKISKESFIFDLMTAYDFPKSTISKLKIKYKDHDDVVVPSKLHFVGVSKKELDSKFDELVKHYSTAKKAPRFIVVTDYQNLKAYDNKVAEKLDTEIKNLSKHPDFFLPWAGIEKKVFQGENPADVKAAEKLAKLFDLILKDNLKLVEKNRHALNVFLTRILFCFFAEDTDIFKKGLFTESLASHTNTDGSDLDDYLQRLFEVLNKKSRTGLPDFLKEFPYVNGGLFTEEFSIPKFTKKSRESLIDLGSDLNWAEINPDIFGSMIQAVVHPDQRSGLGMHYTSVTNIMKVIEPLFLSELKEEFENTKSNKSKLKKLLEKINNIKIFDPACGSGNFLIIAYKELRYLEIKILKELGGFTVSSIPLSNFYGIEIDDFAHEVAKLSLWLAEHQMNVLFNNEFGEVRPTLPLNDAGRIICGNSMRIDWNSFCKTNNEDVVYILGNPPYLGAREQDELHKEDVERVYSKYKAVKKVDYIALWFLKGAEYIREQKSKVKFAYVSTNSICQGEQVSLVWPFVLSKDLEIFFAHQSFKWTNSAKNKAGVTCIIVGIRKVENSAKFLFNGSLSQKVGNISPYLTNSNNVIIERRSKPLSTQLPLMDYGNMAIDEGNLILSPDERADLINNYPETKSMIRKIMGAQEFIKGVERWCLWIPDDKLTDALKIKVIKKRIDDCKAFRLSSTDKGTHKLASKPHQFRETKEAKEIAILIPTVTSENRKYFPIGFVKKNEVVIAPNQVIYDPEPWVFSILSSSLHLVWVRAVAGALETRIRYSSELCYNNFPVPDLSENQKKYLEEKAFNLVAIREKYTERTVASLYDSEIMPVDLLEAHQELDEAVEKCYRTKPFSSDDEKLSFLFSLYETSERSK